MSENFISVDCECGGPTPAFNLCSIGACEVGNPSNSFYVELKPLFPDRYDKEALAVGGFTIESMQANGVEPYPAMRRFEFWLNQWNKPVMVGFNAGFDWQFINYYFHETLRYNPLGINCIDIKALYMGHTGCEWRKTTKRSIPNRYKSDKKHTHNAQDDAIEQSILFKNILDEIRDQ